MKINGTDLREYNAKQLTADIKPPSMAVNYEWMPGALTPIEFETDVEMGHLILCLFFIGKDRNSLIRKMSEFMANLAGACVLELDGYKGKYKGFLTSDDYEKTIVKKRYMLHLEFDGYFYDDEISSVFDGATSGTLYVEGSRKTPCIVEVYAERTLPYYGIYGLGGGSIVIDALEHGSTLVIDGIKGTVMKDGANAFDSVEFWEFPFLKTGKNMLTFSSTGAKVTIRHMPMWI